MIPVTDMRAVLWVKRNDTMFLIDTCNWSTQIAQNKKYFIYDYYCIPDYFNHIEKCDHVVKEAPLYEFYFTQPHVMTDTFYIGFQTLGVDHRPHCQTSAEDSLVGRLYMAGQGVPCVHGSYSPIWSKVKSNTTIGRPDIRYEGKWGCVFPIIELPCDGDSTIVPCPAVENFAYEVLSPNLVSFSWDTVGNQFDFQISFGPYDVPPDSNVWHSTTTNPQSFSHCWDEKTYYAAYIRAQCHKRCDSIDTTYWGSWSQPIYFHTGNFMPDTSHHSAIEALVQGFSQFTLSPNPAHGSVSIVLPQLSYGDPKKHLVLSDDAGKELLRQAFAGDKTDLDITAYPAGAYFVTIVTPIGSATQKLLVE